MMYDIWDMILPHLLYGRDVSAGLRDVIRYKFGHVIPLPLHFHL